MVKKEFWNRPAQIVSVEANRILAPTNITVDPRYIVPWFLQSPRLASQSSYHLAVQREVGAHDSIIFPTPHFLALPLSRAARVFSSTNILGELGGRWIRLSQKGLSGIWPLLQLVMTGFHASTVWLKPGSLFAVTKFSPFISSRRFLYYQFNSVFNWYQKARMT